MIQHNDSQPVERRAKLFEAGAYPDKGVTVTDDHLDALVQGFSGPAPVLIEHADSPLEIGYLTAIERVGSELFGTIRLSHEADALVEKSGARSLSLGLSPDLAQIREVSLVRHPRVASARLFGGEICFEGALVDDLATELRRLREAETERDIADLVRDGRLTPAQTPFARALLGIGSTIRFDGASQSIGQLTRALILAQPRFALGEELAPDPARPSERNLSPEASEFYRRHFPNLSLDEIASGR